jgi:hypothetical protein
MVMSRKARKPVQRDASPASCDTVTQLEHWAVLSSHHPFMALARSNDGRAFGNRAMCAKALEL